MYEIEHRKKLEMISCSSLSIPQLLPQSSQRKTRNIFALFAVEIFGFDVSRTQWVPAFRHERFWFVQVSYICS
jgi:hypothetical protein